MININLPPEVSASFLMDFSLWLIRGYQYAAISGCMKPAVSVCIEDLIIIRFMHDDLVFEWIVEEVDITISLTGSIAYEQIIASGEEVGTGAADCEAVRI